MTWLRSVQIHEHYIHRRESRSKRMLKVIDIQIRKPVVQKHGFDLRLALQFIKGVRAAECFLSRPIHRH